MRAKLRTSEELFAWLFRVIGASCIFVALVFRLNLGPPLDAAFFAGAALILLAPLFRRASVLRKITLEPTPGRLTLKRRGLFGGTDQDTILVRQLTGASMARTGESVLLAVALGSKRHPVVIELESDGDATSVRDALGIGRNGFGVLVWNRGPRVMHGLASGVRILCAALCVGVVIAIFASDTFAATLDVQSAVTKLVVALAAFVTIVPWVIAKRTLALLPHGVHVFEDRPRTYAYRDLLAARVDKNAILLDVSRQKSDREEPSIETVKVSFSHPTALTDGLPAREAEAIALQIQSASERARGPKDPAEHRSHVRTLVGRRPDEKLLDWVMRLDAMADAWRASPPRHGEAVAYRHALWLAVEDHDGDDVIRALAARILSRLDPDAAPPQIRVIAKSVRDPGRADRLRVAIEPEVEPFVKALEAKGRAR